jgi:hypothetical protein
MILLIFADTEGVNRGPWNPGDTAVLSVLPRVCKLLLGTTVLELHLVRHNCLKAK